MPRNGVGTYTLAPNNPVQSGQTISSTWANTTLTDIANALSTSIATDGQSVPTANLPMGGFRHTGVADAQARTDYASAGQVQDSSLTTLNTIAGTNIVTAVAPLGMTAYATGQSFRFVASGANTGAVTLNINGIGAKSVTKNGTTALVANDILANSVISVTYDGTQFQLLNPATVGTGSLPSGIAYLANAETFTAPQRGTITTDNDLSFDLSVTNNFVCTPTGTGTLTFTNLVSGQSGYVILKNTGGYAISKNALVLASTTFLTTISTAGNYLLAYHCDSSNVYITSSGVLA